MRKKNTSLKLVCMSTAFSVLALCCNAQTAGMGAMPPNTKVIKDEDNYTAYAVYKDDKSMYVKLFITDSLQKRKVLQHGMELWIDTKGKKNKTTGILFPLPPGGNTFPGGGNRTAAGDPPPSFQNNSAKKGADTSTADLVLKRQDVVLKGFAGDNINGQANVKSLPGGITVSLQMIGDTMVYEASMPFSVVGVNPSADKALSIGIVEKGIELPGFGDGDGGPGGPGGFDGGGPPGGDGGGPPPGPPPGGFDDGGVDFRRLFATNVIWYKLRLDK